MQGEAVLTLEASAVLRGAPGANRSAQVDSYPHLSAAGRDSVTGGSRAKEPEDAEALMCFSWTQSRAPKFPVKLSHGKEDRECVNHPCLCLFFYLL